MMAVPNGLTHGRQVELSLVASLVTCFNRQYFTAAAMGGGYIQREREKKK